MNQTCRRDWRFEAARSEAGLSVRRGRSNGVPPGSGPSTSGSALERVGVHAVEEAVSGHVQVVEGAHEAGDLLEGPRQLESEDAHPEERREHDVLGRPPVAGEEPLPRWLGPLVVPVGEG